MHDEWVLDGDVDPLGQLADLVRHLVDARVLVLLAVLGPLRRVDLAARVSAMARRRIGDGQLGDTLDRLTHRRLVVSRQITPRRTEYQLTDRGADRARRLRLWVESGTAAGVLPRQPTGDVADLLRDPVFPERWSRTLVEAGCVSPLTPAERHDALSRLAAQMAKDPHDPAVSQRVGEGLAERFGAAEALGGTIALIAGEADPRARLLSHLAVGFAHAMQRRTLEAQEWLRVATVWATRAGGQARS